MAEWPHTIIDLEPAYLDLDTLIVSAKDPDGNVVVIYQAGAWSPGWGGLIIPDPPFLPTSVEVVVSTHPPIGEGGWEVTVSCESGKGTLGGGTWSFTLVLPPPLPVPWPPGVYPFPISDHPAWVIRYLLSYMKRGL